ncbi:MAG: metal ABC transporter substrate-binding protein [Gammaproteobacteria bacterium]|nr:metal ABC transporter substrate-binding protein [Gammaproteobacteria bacterium]
MIRKGLVGKAVLIILAALCAPMASSAKDAVPVVASFSILGDWVSEVGGDRVSVVTLVGPDGDAHVYQPTPADARAVAGAKAVFINGLGFEGWFTRLIEASGSRAVVVNASEGIEAIAGEEEEAGESSHGAVDPHAWQSVPNALLYVGNIRDGLCRIDAAGCPVYRENAARYGAALEELDMEIRAVLGRIPTAKRRIITSHDAFGYFAHEYGVEFLAPQGVSTESEASAADVARIIRQIRDDGAGALFVENISDPRLLEQIGRETGLKPGGRLYSDALSEQGEPAGTYLDMMRHNVSTIAAALGGK